MVPCSAGRVRPRPPKGAELGLSSLSEGVPFSASVLKTPRKAAYTSVAAGGGEKALSTQRQAPPNQGVEETQAFRGVVFPRVFPMPVFQFSRKLSGTYGIQVVNYASSFIYDSKENLLELSPGRSKTVCR